MEIKSKKKKLVTLFMVLALFSLVAMNSYIVGDQAEASATGEAAVANQYEGIIRLHIIANSDSDEDQNLKLRVRNNILAKVENNLATEFEEAGHKVDRVQVARKYITENLKQINLWAKDCVRGAGYDYSVKTELGVKAIPAKQYDEIYFPAGNYEALTITLGKGEGKNWWCVIFPPLCLIDCANTDEYKEFFGYNKEGRIVLKSKIKEIINKEKIKQSRR